jgi:hypothetical protein
MLKMSASDIEGCTLFIPVAQTLGARDTRPYDFVVHVGPRSTQDLFTAAGFAKSQSMPRYSDLQATVPAIPSFMERTANVVPEECGSKRIAGTCQDD